ncbi:PQQ-dependent sugar dehydrogenase [Adhaeribacter pallidiroseus]|uniref:Cytochrome c-551 n=1 Tax=Adhaeribacter pallidiroseus TaxID=2072847 RepID=A0A369QTT0_9BACT|nr:PQQ-dependent sugar dehydrogenase [Adhaeribacter pallidiroseus]RDC66219.1 hypothetical protein AHMF7616_04850 [Adhaeribacter pallidiroseus]
MSNKKTLRKQLLTGSCWSLLVLAFYACTNLGHEKKVLVFTQPKTSPEAATAGVFALQKLAPDHKFKVDTAFTASRITEDSLKNYAAVVFLNSSPEALGHSQQVDLERFVQAGGKVIKPEPVTTPEKFNDATYQKQLGTNIESEIAKTEKLDYSKATVARVPEESRFVQQVLDQNLDEPMQMTVLDEGKVLFIERRGNVKLYDPAKKATRVISKFTVHTEGNYEDGLLGVTKDPNFSKNHWVYFYYSPEVKESKQNLSRFTMIGDSLDMKSETLVMEVPVQRETCCHSAGGLVFGPEGYLYISTGDNTSSKESDGFSPLDERPGRGPFDSQKSSGNTNDLRGKILRIIPKAEGGYDIPEGNLFPKGTPKTRPEIYVMGTRNAFRFSIDAKTKYLYWGDVGPDGGKDGPQGPRSYDEWNQARKAGNHGWPYFVGDNKPYSDWDFATNTAGPLFDPARPVNKSPNNTGMEVLPPAQLPMIWYPYDESKEFPELGKGSRSAMAGPVYYSEMYGDSKKKFPAYYDGKLFIYEWARSWVKVISFNEDGTLKKIEPFLPNSEVFKPIDMQFGPDGAMYLLQYGANYFARNPDARLVRIEYTEGNRAPVATIVADKQVGAAPLQVKLSAKESYDYDKTDKLTYEWRLTPGGEVTSREADATFTLDKPGVYKPELTVKDDKGETTITQTEIKVGNEPPQVVVDITGNRSFFFDNNTFNYNVKVSDKEEGSLGQGIDASQVVLAFDYLPQGKDYALISAASKSGNVATKFLKGKALIDGSDCKSCHDLEKKSIGPSYKMVSERYAAAGENSVGFLAEKIIKGGNGNWGHSLMAAHPQHSKAETSDMVRYILSLSATNNAGGSLPLQGKFTTKEHIGTGEEGSYIITASYRDKGSEFTGPLTDRKTLVLRHPKVQAEDYDGYQQINTQRPPNSGGLGYVDKIQNNSWISFKNIDLTGIESLVFRVNANGTRYPGGTIEVHSGSLEGPVVATAVIKNTMVEAKGPLMANDPRWTEIAASVTNSGAKPQDLYVVFQNKEVAKRDLFLLDWINFNRKSPRS